MRDYEKKPQAAARPEPKPRMPVNPIRGTSSTARANPAPPPRALAPGLIDVTRAPSAMEEAARKWNAGQ